MKIKTQIFSIVRLLHHYGVLHGDLSARNFIVIPGGDVYLIDFSFGQFVQFELKSAKGFYADIKCLKQNFGIAWSNFKRLNYTYIRANYYQSCIYPNGFISLGDGQGSTSRKFMYLGIKSLKGNSFLDVGCAEGEVCRHAYRRGAKNVMGIDINDKALIRGRKINELYGYNPIRLKKGDVRYLLELTGDRKYDVVTCFSLLHHLLPDKENLDMLEAVSNRNENKTRTLLIEYINGLLSVTQKILFLELPFLYLRMSDRTLETGIQFCENVAHDINGKIHSLGIWHANNKKAPFIFRIHKPGFEVNEDLLYLDHMLDAWHRNLPVVPTGSLRPDMSFHMPALIKRLINKGRVLSNKFW